MRTTIGCAERSTASPRASGGPVGEALHWDRRRPGGPGPKGRLAIFQNSTYSQAGVSYQLSKVASNIPNSIHGANAVGPPLSNLTPQCIKIGPGIGRVIFLRISVYRDDARNDAPPVRNVNRLMLLADSSNNLAGAELEITNSYGSHILSP